MYKVPENELTIEAVKKAIFNISECVYFNADSERLGSKYPGMGAVDFAEHFINEFAEDLYKVAKEAMFPISKFRYTSTEKMHLVGGKALFNRPAFLVMPIEASKGGIKAAPTSSVEEEPELYEGTNLYMLDDGEVYVIDSMDANLGNHTDVKYNKIRCELDNRYTKISLEEMEKWFAIIRLRREKFVV